MKVSIFTPTYNRAYILGKAYESLVRQSCKDFEWVIVDDGSTDDTEALVKSWLDKDNGFEIIYSKQEHMGPIRVLNLGLQLVRTQWFFMLDNDDWIKEETVEKVIGWLKEIEDDKKFVGIGFARCYPSGAYMKDQVPLIPETPGYVDASNIERAKYHLDMDMVEVSRVDVLKEHPFHIWPGEEYAPQQISYNEIALAGYKYRWRADRLYICEYLPDGLTKDDKIVKKNPMGFAMMHNQNILLNKQFSKKCRSAMQMTALTICGRNLSYLRNSNSPLATFITFPAGVLLAIRRKRQFIKMS